MLYPNQISESICWTFLGLLLVVESFAFCTFIARDSIQVIQQKAGYDIKLHCDSTALLGRDRLGNTKIDWFFKQCSGYSCEDYQQDNWVHLPCEEYVCGRDLLLRNITDQYTGLYRCAIYPYRLDDSTPLDIQTVRIYQLVVINESPEFINTFQKNETVIEVGSRKNFECRVLSMTQATIKWFRRMSEINADTEHIKSSTEEPRSRLFRYNGHIYKILDADSENATNDNIYFSKFVLSRVQPKDQGFYACVAINYHGYAFRETFLRVYEPNDVQYWADYDFEPNETDPKQFWLLFLIPLCLAALPLSILLCYIISKKFEKDSTETTSDEHVYFTPYQPNEWR